MTLLPRSLDRRGRREVVTGLMVLVAGSLAIMSALHLSGILGGGAKPFDPTDAGIAETVIACVLLGGAVALTRGSRILPPVALAFAIIGFLVGLHFTTGSGDAIDVAYHATVLPLLALTLTTLVRTRT